MKKVRRNVWDLARKREEAKNLGPVPQVGKRGKTDPRGGLQLSHSQKRAEASGPV